MSLPAHLAEELIASGDAVPSVMTRSVGDVVQFLVGSINTSADLITVAVASVALPKAMRKVTEHLRGPHTDGQAQLVLRRAGDDLVVDIPAGVSLDEAEAMVTRAFAAASASPG